MNSFKISSIKDLSELYEDVITLKKITSDNVDNLKNLILMVHKKYPNGSTETIPVNTFDGNLINTMKAEINIDFKIVDCSISKLEVKHPLDVTLQISFETLADKLKALKAREDKSRSNVKNEIEKWQKSVYSLFHEIIEWIKPYSENINHEISTFTAYEEFSGSYEMPTLTIKPFIGKTIVFNPFGTFILGAEGRIDINISNFGKSIMLFLHRIEGKDKWDLIIDRDVQDNKVFKKSQFIDLLDEVISV